MTFFWKTMTIFFIFCSSLCAYLTENVHIVVIDGARYSETFGDTSHKFIPLIWNKLRPQATIFTRHYNDSVTLTVSSHLSIITGKWQNFSNDGTERSATPTIFEYFRKSSNSTVTNSFVILGKDKLDVLSSSTSHDYGSKYGASVAYSNDQNNDKVTLQNFKSTLQKHHPRLSITNLGQVDNRGHNGNWNEYTSSIRCADSVIYEMWNSLQNDPIYKDKSTLIITNDHGRHIDDWTSHGDGCEGCRHVMMMVMGPDSKKALIDSTFHTHLDIALTVAELLDFPTPSCTGAPLIPMQLPKPPVLSNFKDTIPLNSTLFWDSVNRASLYHVQISADQSFSQIVIDSLTHVNCFGIEALSVNSTYYVRICSINKAGPGVWSKSKSFYIVPYSPPDVFLVSPEDAVLVNNNNINFTWKVSTHSADHYYLQVAADSLMKNIILSDSTISSLNRFYTFSHEKTALWWRVKAHYGSGWGRWSQKRQFTIIDTTTKHSFYVKHIHVKKSFIKINLNLPISTFVKIRIYSINGLLLNSINYNLLKSGFNSIIVNDIPKTSGYYIMELEAGPFTTTRKFHIF